MIPGIRSVMPAVLFGVLLLSVGPRSYAESGSFMFSKKFYGAVSTASSLFFFKEAYDARKEANRNYDSYKTAGDSQQALNFYNESKRGDTRMAIMLGLGGGTLAYGIYLLMLDEGQGILDHRNEDVNRFEIKGIRLHVASDLQNKGLQFYVNRRF